MERLLTIEEVSQQLGIAVQTLYRWRSDGTDMPQAIKIGGRLRWRQEEVDRWILEKEQRTRSS